MNDWTQYYDREPWGEERADWRQVANQMTWGRILGGGGTKLPNPMWPYFEPDVDPQALLKSIEATDANLEPKPGGGYKWKVQRGDET